MKKPPQKLTLALIFLAVLILMLLWMQGAFRSRVGAERVAGRGAGVDGQLHTVALRPVLDWQEAPGLVASRVQPQVAAQAMGRIVEVRVAPGDEVKAGQVLAVLDDAELRSRLGQAQDHLAAIQAQYQQARSDFHRFRNLVERKVAPVREFDQVRARYESLAAQVQQAREAVNEAQATFRYGKVVAPGDGLVAEKFINVGDLANPGRPLFTVFDPRQMRLEAQVAEQFGPRLQPGGAVRVSIASLGLELDTVIDEVVAQAASASRTFLVKARLPSHSELRPGMFGRLSFEAQSRPALLIPVVAVKDTGQLETVRVAGPEGVRARQVRTGKRYGADVEILSGLEAGETVVLPKN